MQDTVQIKARMVSSSSALFSFPFPSGAWQKSPSTAPAEAAVLPPPSAEGSPPSAASIGQSVVVLSSGSTGLSEGLPENIFLDVITHMLQVISHIQVEGSGVETKVPVTSAGEQGRARPLPSLVWSIWLTQPLMKHGLVVQEERSSLLGDEEHLRPVPGSQRNTVKAATSGHRYAGTGTHRKTAHTEHCPPLYASPLPSV